MLLEVNHELGISRFSLRQWDNYSKELLSQLEHAPQAIRARLPEDNLPDNVTWQNLNYNIFTVLGSSRFAWLLWQDLEECVRDHFAMHEVQRDCVWLRSWLNHHNHSQRLRSHCHDWPIHGYVSIEPQNSRTVFTSEEQGEPIYTVHNTPGTVYIGPGHRWHSVEYDSEFPGTRITLGFDIETRDRIVHDDWSLFPLAI